MTIDTATVEAARLLLGQLGLTPDDLRWTPVITPTFAEYLPIVCAASGPGARRTYGTYWTHVLTAFGDRRLDQVTVTDVEILMRHVMSTHLERRNTRGGVYAGEHLLASLRALYTRAVADGLVDPRLNPAAQVSKPRRPISTRRALSNAELNAINNVAATSGNDTALDTLLLRLHTETACRRSAAIRLQQDDLDEQWCLIQLHEKNGNIHWQPASPTLIKALATHRDHRGTDNPEEPLLRYRDGTPLTTRRYDHLWTRIGATLPWVTAQGISTHWLRHTTITWVERHFGYGIARAYAGHASTKGTATTTYIRGRTHEIATALTILTGETHPYLQGLSQERCFRPDTPG